MSLLRRINLHALVVFSLSFYYSNIIKTIVRANRTANRSPNSDENVIILYHIRFRERNQRYRVGAREIRINAHLLRRHKKTYPFDDLETTVAVYGE